jgi:hypothetical protein
MARDEAIRMIRRIGRKNWKKKIGYHCRSLAETATELRNNADLDWCWIVLPRHG